MKKCIAILICSIMGWGCHPNPQNESTTGPSKNTEPIAYAPEQYLKEHLKGWRIASNTDYANLWWSFYGKTGETTKITSDFNDDGLSDFALLLRSDAQPLYKLVFLVSQKGAFKVFEAEDFHPTTGEQLQHGLFVEPPGRIDVAYPEIKSLILKSNAITLRHLEVNECIYYWDNNRFNTFTMGRNN